MIEPKDLGDVRELVRKAPAFENHDLVYIVGVTQDHELGHILLRVTHKGVVEFTGNMLGDMTHLPAEQKAVTLPPWAVLQRTGVN